MNELFGHEKTVELLELYAAIEKRFADLLLEIKPQKPGLLAFLEGLLRSERTSSNQPLWRQETEEIVRALAARNTQQLASLLNLHALNSAIEAARYEDVILAQRAEELRRFSGKAKSFAAEE
ncbi:hypothetical protein CDA63_17100 [Hymenobacter amundsenii]|uniref:Uncharacterized protein n=1 Tax=Hymenobacter amundsenii TaxID=2006685 RepID=A0A246FH57_9BACT|nr:hypothetical protein [Hymenobacter amundsenii]OWP61859.1 hypothetical protein CDA63_17100 [Hymenobacter amundsenii]